MAFSSGICIATAVAVGAVESCQNLLENTSHAAARVLRLPQRRAVVPLNGQVAIVTGGNAGIGFATARKLAERGAHVVLACRSKERGEKAAQELARVAPLPGCAPPVVEFRALDLGSLASVRAFARGFNRSGRPLHILVCNAGIMSPPARLVTSDGHEMQFQVNFLSHFLLSHDLMAEQRRRRRASTARGGGGRGAAPRGGGQGPDGTRLVLLSSLTHHAGPAQWDDKQSERGYNPFTSYALSKMANLMAASEFQRRFARNADRYGGGDSAVSVHPGIVNTSLATGFFEQTGGAGLPWAEAAAKGAMQHLFPLVLRSPDASAEDMLVACQAPARRVAGRYLSNGAPSWASAFAADERRCADLWELACGLTGVETHESLA
ncbi:MAG: hypothetical protein J3K34DRAFT_525883 [Monoraphidium minutum]|nr:MAG: hypothetical protein J3K34DRAFT_525883 [Monoraphidium minutum]